MEAASDGPERDTDLKMARRDDAMMPTRGELDDQAVDWVVRVHAGGAARTEFDVWRARSPAHEAAAREAEAVWRDLGQTRAARDFASGRGDTVPARNVPRRRAVRHTAWGMALAAMLAVGIFVSGAFGPVSSLYADHATAVGGQMRVALPDGSVAVLNTATALSVDYSTHTRRLVLHDGEAVFEVAKDAARPFVVAAGKGEVEAVGTVFDVRRDGRDVTVIVAEGTVLVRGPVGVDRLSAGQFAKYGPADPSMRVGTANAAAFTAWSRGKIIFNRRPLGEVMAELDRYRQGGTVIDASLQELEVTGVFDLDDLDALLRTVETTLPVRIERLPFVILVRPAG